MSRKQIKDSDLYFYLGHFNRLKIKFKHADFKANFNRLKIKFKHSEFKANSNTFAVVQKCTSIKYSLFTNKTLGGSL
jgi:hypothetical protein